MLNSIIVTLLISYLLGSCNFAIIIAKLKKLDDPRAGGSHNPGATNMLRMHGKLPAILTLCGDLGKSAVIIFWLKHNFAADFLIALAGLAAFLGHLYPLFFKFKGGKGVATFFGILVGINILFALVIFSIWFATYRISKISSLAAICTAIFAPILAYFYFPIEYIFLIFSTALLMLVRHRDNIKRLYHKQEISTSSKVR